jgi:hypothetical protein
MYSQKITIIIIIIIICGEFLDQLQRLVSFSKRTPLHEVIIIIIIQKTAILGTAHIIRKALQCEA